MSLLPRATVTTRDELELALAEIGVRRVRVIEVQAAALMVFCVRPKHRAAVADLLAARLPVGVGFAVVTLGFFENLITRKTYVVV